jgi:hypothetical protein
VDAGAYILNMENQIELTNVFKSLVKSLNKDLR